MLLPRRHSREWSVGNAENRFGCQTRCLSEWIQILNLPRRHLRLAVRDVQRKACTTLKRLSSFGRIEKSRWWLSRSGAASKQRGSKTGIRQRLGVKGRCRKPTKLLRPSSFTGSRLVHDTYFAFSFNWHLYQ